MTEIAERRISSERKNKEAGGWKGQEQKNWDKVQKKLRGGERVSRGLCPLSTVSSAVTQTLDLELTDHPWGTGDTTGQATDKTQPEMGIRYNKLQ